MIINQNIPHNLPIPWHWVNNDLTIQLAKEMPYNHILAGKKLRTIARRQDNDDVLFEILHEDEYRYAVVHLVWSRSRQEDKNYPSIDLYRDWEDVYKNRILTDSEDWED